MKKREKYLIGIIFIFVIGYIISANFKETKTGISSIDILNDTTVVDVKNNFLLPIPASISFAGEEMELAEPDLIERFDREIIVNTNFHSSTILLIKRSQRWIPQILPVLKENNIPDDFIYLPMIESGFTNDQSSKGAVGYWQLLAETARELGLEVNSEVDERYDPVKSTAAACKYLLKAKEKFGTWTNAAASYNMGMRGLARSMENQRVDDYKDLLLNEETSRYLFRIVAIKMIVSDPEKFGFNIPVQDRYQMESTEALVIEETIPDLTEFAFSREINYKILKRYNPWLRNNSLTIKSRGKKYIVKIPSKHPEQLPEDVHISDSSMIGEDRIKEDE